MRIVTLVAGLLIAFQGDMSPQNQRADNLLTARDFLRVAYPELSQLRPVMTLVKQLPIAAPFDFREFSLYINDAGAEREREREAEYLRNALLSAHFTFGQTGRIEEYFAEGRLVRDADNDALAHDLQRHPEWSTEMLVAEIKLRGARFGPDKGAELIASLQARQFEPMFGELTFLSATFEFPTATQRRYGGGGGTLNWIVFYQSSTGLQVMLHIEPFSGVLKYAAALTAP
jgi:hypothetical protein